MKNEHVILGKPTSVVACVVLVEGARREVDVRAERSLLLVRDPETWRRCEEVARYLALPCTVRSRGVKWLPLD